MTEQSQVHLVQVSYSDYDDSWDAIVGSFSNKEDAEALAAQYRVAFDPKDVQRPSGWRDLDRVRVDVYPVPFNTAVAPPARIFLAYAPGAPEHVMHWSGVVLGVFDTTTGDEFFHAVMPNFAPTLESIQAAIASPGEVVSYAATAYHITHDGERGAHGTNYQTVATEVEMLMSMDSSVLKAALLSEPQD